MAIPCLNNRYSAQNHPTTNWSKGSKIRPAGPRNGAGFPARIPKITGETIMHEPRPIPRGQNETKSFDDDLIARTLSNAADIRRTLKFSRGRPVSRRRRTSQRPRTGRSGIDLWVYQAGINRPMSGRFSGRPGPPLARRNTFPKTHRLRHRNLRQRPQHNRRNGSCRPG